MLIRSFFLCAVLLLATAPARADHDHDDEPGWEPSDISCSYNNRYFEVTYQGQSYSTSGNKQISGEVRCYVTRDLAAVYDGTYFIVFDAKAKKIEYTSANRGYDGYKMRAHGGLAALYDGRYFLAYDTNTGRIEYTTVSSSKNPKMAVGHGIAALYEGSYFLVYSQSRGRIDYTTARGEASAAKILAGDNIVLGAAGGYALWSCGGEIQWTSARGEVRGGRGHPRARTLQLSVGSYNFTLAKEGCKLTY